MRVCVLLCLDLFLALLCLFSQVDSDRKSKNRGLLGGVSKHKGAIIGGLAGAAAGYVTYKAGKRILSGAGHIFLPDYHRNYYFGNSYYRPSGPNRVRCSYYIGGSTDPDEVYYFDETRRVEHIVFDCDAYSQQCCDMDCCPRTYTHHHGSNVTVVTFRWWYLIVALFILGLIACGTFLFCRFVLKKSWSFFSRSGGGANKDFAEVPMDDAQTNYTAQSQPYPAAYGNPYGYPQQPAGGFYPNQPPPPGFNAYGPPPAYPQYPMKG